MMVHDMCACGNVQVEEEERLERIRIRQQKAVPVEISGARWSRINGCYEPVDEV